MLPILFQGTVYGGRRAEVLLIAVLEEGLGVVSFEIKLSEESPFGHCLKIPVTG